MSDKNLLFDADLADDMWIAVELSFESMFAFRCIGWTLSSILQKNFIENMPDFILLNV